MRPRVPEERRRNRTLEGWMPEEDSSNETVAETESEGLAGGCCCCWAWPSSLVMESLRSVLTAVAVSISRGKEEVELIRSQASMRSKL